MDKASSAAAVKGGLPHPEEAILAEIRAALGVIEYGSILITIHQGKVVGLETTTKRRLPS
jgi:hypothetical protein